MEHHSLVGRQINSGSCDFCDFTHSHALVVSVFPTAETWAHGAVAHVYHVSVFTLTFLAKRVLLAHVAHVLGQARAWFVRARDLGFFNYVFDGEVPFAVRGIVKR